MVPWGLVLSTAAWFAFPQHRGTIAVAGAVRSLLIDNRKRQNAGEDEDFDENEDDDVKRIHSFYKLGGSEEGEGLASIRVRESVLEWENLECNLLQTKSKKGHPGVSRVLLNRVSGVALPGRVLAIMGPSGSGKTTLLTALAGQMPAGSGKLQLRGKVTVNGKCITQSNHKQAFVRQEDIFFSQLTVYETLMTSAELQLPTSLGRRDKEKIVETLILRMGLSPVRNSRVGDAKTRGISGGEKKRLAIASELMGSPSVIFADEPTTGLDAFQAEQVMKDLCQLAHHGGHTVICSIHQPRGSVYALFDDLMLLAGGQLAYSGPARESAIRYFEKLGYSCPVHSNPAEFFSDLVGLDFSNDSTLELSKKRIDGLIESFKIYQAVQKQKERAIVTVGLSLSEKSENLNGTPKALVKREKRGKMGRGLKRVWIQFRLLLTRAWRQSTRDKATNFVRAAMNITSAIIFGSVFWNMGRGQTSIQDRMGLLQVAAINTAMASLTKTLNVFPKERAIVDRERSKKGSYGFAPYLCSKLIAELPISSLFPSLFGFLVYPMAGLQRSFKKFLSFLSITTLESFTSSAMGLVIGCIVSSTEAGMALGPSVMTLFIVFGGYYVNEENTPFFFRWIPNVSLIKWAFQALSINEFTGLKFDRNRPTDMSTGEQVLADRLSFISLTDGDVKGAPPLSLSHPDYSKNNAKQQLRKCLARESQILLFWYYCAAYLLKKKKPKFIQLEYVEDEASVSEAPISEQTPQADITSEVISSATDSSGTVDTVEPEVQQV